MGKSVKRIFVAMLIIVLICGLALGGLETVTGEEFEEFYPDEDTLYEMILFMKKWSRKLFAE